MANEQNLKVLSPSEAREFGRIGGIMSGQSRREQKRVQEIAKAKKAEEDTTNTTKDKDTTTTAKTTTSQKVKIVVDGNNVKEETVSVGSSVSLPLTFLIILKQLKT